MPKRSKGDNWEYGDSYEQYIGRWSRLVAPQFLAWLSISKGRRWLDVGCGTGALCRAILEDCSPASLVGVDPSEGFLAKANETLAGRAKLSRSIATAIPLIDASVDVCCSALVLNFISDPHQAVTEMSRVTRDGGRVAAYLWDYAGKMELIRFFWDTVLEIDPRGTEMDEGTRFPLCRPEALTLLFRNAGLHAVEATAIDITTSFSSFEDYWLPFLGGQGPAPTYVIALDGSNRQRLRERLRQRLAPQADGSIVLTARAWAVQGTVARSAVP